MPAPTRSRLAANSPPPYSESPRPLACRPHLVLAAALAMTFTACHCGGKLKATSHGPRPEAAPLTAADAAVGVATPPVAGAPYIVYTDLVAGPTSGGEKNKGAYLSVFGTNFGTTGAGSTTKLFIGGVEVDNYRTLGPSRGRPDIQQLTVQVGALGKPTPGRPLPIKLVVDGVASNTNHTFTVQPGDILFVSTTGDDATAAKNDIAHPWRHVQTPTEGGALGAVGAGDVIVLRGGPAVVWSDVGYDNRWLRFRRVTGNAPTGAKGHGYLSIVAYPGEDVHYVPPPRTSGGIHGIGEDYPEFSDWIVISGLHIESVASSLTDGAPVNLQAKSDHWRVVNNDLGPWPADAGAGDKAGGVVGNGKTGAVLGNHIHDIGGGKENHGVYLDSGSTDIEIAYNTIHDVAAGNLIQTYDNIGGVPLERIAVHHNLMYRGGRYALNISEGTHTYSAWNNVIYETAFAGVRFAVESDAGTYFAIVHNTIFDANTVTSPTCAPIVNDEALNKGTVIVSGNIIATDAGSRATSYLVDGPGAQALDVDGNLWSGLGVAPSEDVHPVHGANGRGDPMFSDAAHRDFSLRGESAAVDQGTAGTPLKVDDDYRLKARPAGGRPDVGAYEL